MVSEVGERARKQGAARLRKPCPHVGIREGRVDRLIERVDDLGQRHRGGADADRRARLKARHRLNVIVGLVPAMTI